MTRRPAVLIVEVKSCSGRRPPSICAALVMKLSVASRNKPSARKEQTNGGLDVTSLVAWRGRGDTYEVMPRTIVRCVVRHGQSCLQF